MIMSVKYLADLVLCVCQIFKIRKTPKSTDTNKTYGKLVVNQPNKIDWITARENELKANAIVNIKNYTQRVVLPDRKSTRLNSSHVSQSRMPSSA